MKPDPKDVLSVWPSADSIDRRTVRDFGRAVYIPTVWNPHHTTRRRAKPMGVEGSNKVSSTRAKKVKVEKSRVPTPLDISLLA